MQSPPLRGRSCESHSTSQKCLVFKWFDPRPENLAASVDGIRPDAELLSQLYSTGMITATPSLPDDLNRDDQVTVADVQAMMTAMSDLNDFQLTNNLTAPELLSIGDLGNSGPITNADIQGLIGLLSNKASGGSGGALTPVSEPTSFALFRAGVFGNLAITRALRLGAGRGKPTVDAMINCHIMMTSAP
jgi:hypothetical protein